MNQAEKIAETICAVMGRESIRDVLSVTFHNEGYQRAVRVHVTEEYFRREFPSERVMEVHRCTSCHGPDLEVRTPSGAIVFCVTEPKEVTQL